MKADFVKEYYLRYGAGTSVRQIMKMVGIKSTSTFYRYLKYNGIELVGRTRYVQNFVKKKEEKEAAIASKGLPEAATQGQPE